MPGGGLQRTSRQPINRRQLIETVAQYALSESTRAAVPAASLGYAVNIGPNGRISSQFANDPALAGILPGFVERLPSQLDALSKALDEDRLEDAERLAHRMKGAGGSYGYPTLSEVAKSLELAAKARDVGAAASALVGIKVVCAAIQAGSTGPVAEVSEL